MGCAGLLGETVGTLGQGEAAEPLESSIHAVQGMEVWGGQGLCSAAREDTPPSASALPRRHWRRNGNPSVFLQEERLKPEARAAIRLSCASQSFVGKHF